jgi:hypothetical protein
VVGLVDDDQRAVLEERKTIFSKPRGQRLKVLRRGGELRAYAIASTSALVISLPSANAVTRSAARGTRPRPKQGAGNFWGICGRVAFESAGRAGLLRMDYPTAINLNRFWPESTRPARQYWKLEETRGLRHFHLIRHAQIVSSWSVGFKGDLREGSRQAS